MKKIGLGGKPKALVSRHVMRTIDLSVEVSPDVIAAEPQILSSGDDINSIRFHQRSETPNTLPFGRVDRCTHPQRARRVTYPRNSKSEMLAVPAKQLDLLVESALGHEGVGAVTWLPLRVTSRTR